MGEPPQCRQVKDISVHMYLIIGYRLDAFPVPDRPSVSAQCAALTSQYRSLLARQEVMDKIRKFRLLRTFRY